MRSSLLAPQPVQRAECLWLTQLPRQAQRAQRAQRLAALAALPVC
jgi:hypothetical protein